MTVEKVKRYYKRSRPFIMAYEQEEGYRLQQNILKDPKAFLVNKTLKGIQMAEDRNRAASLFTGVKVLGQLTGVYEETVNIKGLDDIRGKTEEQVKAEILSIQKEIVIDGSDGSDNQEIA